MFHIILHEPEIPPNTHLVQPLGFALDAKHLRRAGLDYRALAEIEIHADFAACRACLGGTRLFAVESGSPTRYCDVRFEPGDAFVFGSETRGLPRTLVDGLPVHRQLALPMLAGNRSLNLSNAVAAVTYEAWRQNGFASAAIPRGLRGS